ncbi:hypothetical protein K461DRAFT_280561 [Myriangium duriaei CBS 260.36]|uniref:F-box domain-containing protein n=1 Tax=Myriangium duriaei CBS 260.36 TaxID=1168546 RepID=A0A9P4IV78_9PEZI|nr:hypothetical protein K461DRAFT_280561 [Myriangium duriaei CBS 260.36]
MTDRVTTVPSSAPIAKLTNRPEILLQIFKITAQNSGQIAILGSIARCCRAWYPFAQATLYGDVFLQGQRLDKFTGRPAYLDQLIRSLTLQIDHTIDHQVPENEHQALHALALRIPGMHGLTSLSIHAECVAPGAALESVIQIIGHLPVSCVGLDIDIKGAAGHPHICPSISRLLHQLRHLRIRLPRICPELFQTLLEGQQTIKTARAPLLEDCTINLALGDPGPYSNGASTITCGSTNSLTATQALRSTSVLAALEAFCAHNATLRRFWVVDSQSKPRQPANTSAAWIRRDFLTKTSHPIPLARIGGFRKDTNLARLPRGDGVAGTEDWISWTWALEELVEGCTWELARTDVRLPRAVMVARGYPPQNPALTKAQFLLANNNHSCRMWVNEEATGQRVLPEHDGELMQTWDLQEKIPAGWRRDNVEGAPMVRI